MKRLAVVAVIAVMCFATLSLAAAAPASSEARLNELEQRTATSTAGEFARNLLTAAKASIMERSRDKER